MRYFASATVLGVALVLTACSDGSDDSDGEENSEANSETNAETNGEVNEQFELLDEAIGAFELLQEREEGDVVTGPQLGVGIESFELPVGEVGVEVLVRCLGTDSELGLRFAEDDVVERQQCDNGMLGVARDLDGSQEQVWIDAPDDTYWVMVILET